MNVPMDTPVMVTICESLLTASDAMQAQCPVCQSTVVTFGNLLAACRLVLFWGERLVVGVRGKARPLS